MLNVCPHIGQIFCGHSVRAAVFACEPSVKRIEIFNGELIIVQLPDRVFKLVKAHLVNVGRHRVNELEALKLRGELFVGQVFCYEKLHRLREHFARIVIQIEPLVYVVVGEMPEFMPDGEDVLLIAGGARKQKRRVKIGEIGDVGAVVHIFAAADAVKPLGF